MTSPILVAHRGYPAIFPENTLIGMEAAIKAGATALEFDVQISADGLPLVFHDEDLMRVTGRAGRVTNLLAAELVQLSVGEASRFGERFSQVKMNTLDEVVLFLQNYSSVQVFVEIKSESIRRFGVESVVNIVLPHVQPITSHTHIIAFDHRALIYAREQGAASVGWVLEHFDEQARQLAESFEPDFLICNYKKIPQSTDALWPGDWQWMVYATDDIAIARRYYEYGAAYVETDDIGKIMQAALA